MCVLKCNIDLHHIIDNHNLPLFTLIFQVPQQPLTSFCSSLKHFLSGFLQTSWCECPTKMDALERQGIDEAVRSAYSGAARPSLAWPVSRI